jgi:hypothetical protein
MSGSSRRPRTASSSSLTALLLTPFSLLGSFLYSVSTESIAFLFILNGAPTVHAASSENLRRKRKHHPLKPSSVAELYQAQLLSAHQRAGAGDLGWITS